MTPEGKRQADEVLKVLGEAMKQIESFYDCRIVLGSLIGVASAFAGGMYRAGVLTPESLTAYFSSGLEGALKAEGNTPQIHYEAQGTTEVKQ